MEQRQDGDDEGEDLLRYRRAEYLHIRISDRSMARILPLLVYCAISVRTYVDCHLHFNKADTKYRYFMPVRWYNYHKIGFHYFLADLCYFVNFLMILSIWFFPQSKRLFISTYCLAFGNNAVAIAMWRNSLVFHSLDKVTS